MPPIVLALLVLALSAAAALSDLRTGLIPNRMTLGGLLLLLVGQLALNGLQEGALVALSGLLVAALIPLSLYAARGLGGGDVKLMAACGVGLGPMLVVEAQLIAFSVGCLFAIGRAIHRGVLWQTLRGSSILFTNALLPLGKHREVPASVEAPVRFAPFIFAGVALAVLGHWS